MSLTPEEKQRIYQEEKARLEAQEKARAEIEAERARAKAKDEAEKKKRRRVGCLVWLVLIIGGAIYVGISSNSNAPRTSHLEPGQQRYLYKAPFVAVDQAAIDAFQEAYDKKDTYGEAELLASGKIFEVPDVTKVLILDTNTANSRVRILEGKYAGEAVWVRNGWIK